MNGTNPLVECSNCHAVVEAEIVGSYETDDFVGGSPPFLSQVSLLRCRRCNSPLLGIQDLEHNFGTDEFPDWGTVRVLYPNDRPRLGTAVPEPIRRAFDEAYGCYQGNVYVACAVMCGRVLEGICDEQQAQGGGLYRKLQDLERRGVIDRRLAEWADLTRDVRNTAAHELGDSVTRRDAEDLMAFTVAIADYLYTIQRTFEKFRERKAAESQDQENSQGSSN